MSKDSKKPVQPAQNRETAATSQADRQRDTYSSTEKLGQIRVGVGNTR
jgi:hypothetical protein